MTQMFMEKSSTWCKERRLNQPKEAAAAVTRTAKVEDGVISRTEQECVIVRVLSSMAIPCISALFPFHQM